MSEQKQRKDFIESLKRLKIFYDQIPNYKPAQQTLDTVDFLGVDLEQQYKIVDYVKKTDDELEQTQIQSVVDKEKQEFAQMDKTVLQNILSEHKQVPDEEFVKEGMKFNPAVDMNVSAKTD